MSFLWKPVPATGMMKLFYGGNVSQGDWAVKNEGRVVGERGAKIKLASKIWRRDLEMAIEILHCNPRTPSPAQDLV